MINLIVNNSYSEIHNLEKKVFKNLSKSLSYVVGGSDSYYSRMYGPKTVSLLSKLGVFPTGLLTTVLEFLVKSGFKTTDIEVKDLRIKPRTTLETISLQGMEHNPYREQKEAVEACIKANRGIVQAVTGFGKSITMALLVNELKVKTLIVVPNLTLKHALKETFSRLFSDVSNITIENVDSPSLCAPNNYDCLIIDEAHHVAAKTYRILNKKFWNNIYYRFFFTATPFRAKTEENIVFESIAGQLIYSINYSTAVSKKYIVPMEAYYYEMDQKPYKSNSWRSVYNELVVNNKDRNDIICNLMDRLSNSGFPTLCLVKEIEHGNLLSEKTKIPFASGENTETHKLIEQFNNGTINALIGTTGILGEGCDTKPAEYVIIAGLGKSKVAFMQQCGRGFRKHENKESCKIVIFKDNSHKWTRNHFKEQEKILFQEYNIWPTKLEIDKTTVT